MSGRSRSVAAGLYYARQCDVSAERAGRRRAQVRLIVEVHGAQAFTWHEPVVAGDEITTEAEFVEEVKRGDIKVYTFSSRSTNQRGELVCEGTWTNFVR